MDPEICKSGPLETSVDAKTIDNKTTNTAITTFNETNHVNGTDLAKGYKFSSSVENINFTKTGLVIPHLQTMNKIILGLLLLCAITTAKASETFAFEKAKRPKVTKGFNPPDSSNYRLTVVKEIVGQTQLSLSIIGKDNTSEYALIYLFDESGKKLSGLITDNSGKITLLIWDNKVKNVLVTNVGSGRVLIPIEKVRNKVVDVKVQLYPGTFED